MNQQPSGKKIILNLFGIYLIWGSTFLAIKYGIESFPPFLLAGIRFLFASAILFAISYFRGEPGLSRDDLKVAAISGPLLVLGNALVCVAEKSISSGMTAVAVGTIPAWLMLLNWKFFKGNRPRLRQFVGIFIALSGILLLTRSHTDENGVISITAWIALCMSILSWAFGTLIQRQATQKYSLFRFSSTQLGLGGILMLLAWGIFGSPASFDPQSITTVSVFALFYLAILGSVVGFTSYFWLSQNVDTTLVSTYAFVNPVVAVWLGWLIAGETVTLSTFICSAIALSGLYFVAIQPKQRKVVQTNETTEAAYAGLVVKALEAEYRADSQSKRDEKKQA